ncbi:MAG: YtfJ family protein [bacterium]|nr:YtfJ family protein [bacterium]
MKYWLIACLLLLPSFAGAAPQEGSILPPLVLEGDNGGLVQGGAFRSEDFKGKIVVLFYVDPDEKDLNQPAVEALAALPKVDAVQSVAVINLAATWLPNSVIASKLETSQKEHPLTIYAKDLEKVLVKQWNAGDDTYMIALIGADGKVLFAKDGKLNDGDINRLVNTLKQAAQALTGKSMEDLPPKG